jgi:maltokinase
VPDVFPPELIAALPDYLPLQRWFGGSEPPAPSDVHVAATNCLWSGEEGHQLWQMLVDVGEARYQLILGVRPAGEVADFLSGQERAVLGIAENVFVYDGLLDSELTKRLLEISSGGAETAARARPMGAEQSNTSIVYDDRLVFKVFRKLPRGTSADVDITTALAGAGFTHVPTPLVVWRDGDQDYGFGQQFLAGGAEGWALALASLRDLYSVTPRGGAEGTAEASTPAEAGGDFAAEARRLGRVTAEMHVALHEVYGAAPASETAANWSALLASLPDRLKRASSQVDRDLLEAAGPLLERLNQVKDPGPAIRVHGDYHLGQVIRTDLGWYVIDFEGEPARPEDERMDRASPFKDVTGMLRSFHYASRHALVEQDVAAWPEIVPVARAWESHNRQAFLEGYQSHEGVAGLLPEAPLPAVVMAAYELDKALYELDYELAHRPEWVGIPADALERLAGGWID